MSALRTSLDLSLVTQAFLQQAAPSRRRLQGSAWSRPLFSSSNKSEPGPVQLVDLPAVEQAAVIHARLLTDPLMSVLTAMGVGLTPVTAHPIAQVKDADVPHKPFLSAPAAAALVDGWGEGVKSGPAEVFRRVWSQLNPRLMVLEKSVQLPDLREIHKVRNVVLVRVGKGC